jgi:hypothetical protein
MYLVEIDTLEIYFFNGHADIISRITIHLLNYWWNCLRKVERRDKIKTKGRVNK